MGKAKMKDFLYISILISLTVWNIIIELNIVKLEKENKIYHSITHKPKEKKNGN